jgi:hypothetical protein
MGSDMVVALARSTVDGRTLFGHNSHRPTGEGQSLVRVPGRAFAPGESARATHLALPQVRQTHTVLAGRAGGEWGYRHGVNDRGVAAGATSICTRLENEGPVLTGPDLVRLALERAGSAWQAVDVVTDLISRHGQGYFPGAEGGDGHDSALLLADAQEAYLLEASGGHWALQVVGSVRAVSDVCLLRQDWDRISRGLADRAIARGWWPENGTKLDFAGAVGRAGEGHAAGLRRWGRATRLLEQHSGEIDRVFVRHLLGELADLAGSHTAASLLVQASAEPDGVVLAWCAFGPPAASVYFPVTLAAELPAAFGDEGGAGCALWRELTRLQAGSRRDARLGAALRPALADLQRRFDEQAHEFVAEASALRRRGEGPALQRLAESFMQHNWECWSGLCEDLYSGGGEFAPVGAGAGVGE